MLKKIIIGVLIMTVVGAGSAAIAYNAANQEVDLAITTPNPLASNGQALGASEQIAQGEPIAEGMAGEPWEAIGNITAIDEYGFDFTIDGGETVYIELGPPDYWQSQDIESAVGQLVLVTGSINDDMIHASAVQLADGQILELRSDSGQPMWSGGVDNGNGQNGQGTSSADGSHTPDPQAQVDEWITLEGTLMSFQGGNMTMSTAAGDLVNFQTGQPRFFADQGITFQVGDEISVLGFFEGEQFMVGEITQIATELRVMLRDPNGRPLWAGPGNGNGNGGNGGNGHGGNGRNGNGGNSG